MRQHETHLLKKHGLLADSVPCSLPLSAYSHATLLPPTYLQVSVHNGWAVCVQVQ